MNPKVFSYTIYLIATALLLIFTSFRVFLGCITIGSILKSILTKKLDQTKRCTTTMPIWPMTSSDSLPHDVVVDILLRLDADSLMRFKCVCKSWKSLIAHPLFVKMHHKRHRVPHILASLEGYVDHNEWSHKMFLFGCYGNFDRVSELRLPVSPTSERRKSLVVEGSDYGILCLSRFGEDPSTIYLCNPATKQVKALPSLPVSSSNKKYQLGFGYDPLTDDFKVIWVHGRSSLDVDNLFTPSCIVAVYSLRSNSWRRKRMPRILDSYYSSISDVKQHTSRRSCSLVLNGCVHWMLHFGSSRRWPRDLLTGIVAFDLNTEVFRLIETPVKGIVPAVAELSECLSLIACENMSNFINIWVMREYGDSNSWIKQVTIDTTEHELISSCQPLGFASNGFMLLAGVDGFYWYDPHSNNVKMCLSPLMNVWEFTPYVESIFQI